jgi:Xylose isomerase-like TIM barrel
MAPKLKPRHALDVRLHHPLGASTGYMAERRDDWGALCWEAARTSVFAAELAALSEDELPGLVDYLGSGVELPFRFLSVHAPVKERRMPEAALVGALAALPAAVDAIVVHPDMIEEPALYAALGRRLTLENMDGRKDGGRTADELEPLFAELPDAGFCFDVAHAWSIDPAMEEAERLLDRFGGRLRHVHVSSLDADCHHIPLTAEQEALFEQPLSRCLGVPWILEAPLPEL